jgi:hypothetical protein
VSGEACVDILMEGGPYRGDIIRLHRSMTVFRVVVVSRVAARVHRAGEYRRQVVPGTKLARMVWHSDTPCVGAQP